MGDRVWIADIPSDLNPGYKDDPPMRTAALFRFCLGKKFVVRGFDRYGFVELRVDDDPRVKKKFGLNSIWVEPKSIELYFKDLATSRSPEERTGLARGLSRGRTEICRNGAEVCWRRQKGKEKKACNSKLTIRCIL
jgi:hypothetical protein